MIKFNELEFFYDSGEIKLFLPQELKTAPIIGENEFCIKGGELLRRAGANGKLGTLQAEHLVSNQDRIPVEQRKYHFPLTGTIYRHRKYRSLWIPYVIFDDYDNEWRLNFHPLDYYF
ncbi:hypothetical protein HZB06_00350, partial [Candidatus Wolfebacteria bacterium]|nr:hypothetical protein [Candidatus Wolfebacteria bacterium]